MAVPLPWRLSIYAISTAALIASYQGTGSSVASFILTMIVLFGAMQVLLRSNARLPVRDNAEGETGHRWTWFRLLWAASLFAVFHVMPSFGWGATRILAALILMIGFVELETLVNTKSMRAR